MDEREPNTVEIRYNDLLNQLLLNTIRLMEPGESDVGDLREQHGVLVTRLALFRALLHAEPELPQDQIVSIFDVAVESHDRIRKELH